MTMWRHWMVGQVDASIAALVLLAIALVLRQRLSPAIRSALLLIALVRLALPPLVRSPWSEALVDLPPVDDTRMQMTEWLSADVSFLLAGVTLVSVALVATREDGSDDWAVTHTSRDPFTYARALLQSARMIAVPHPLTAAGAHPMGKRLRRLLNGRANRDDRVGIAGIAMVLVAATFCIPGAHMPELSASDQPVVIIQRVVRDAAIDLKQR